MSQIISEIEAEQLRDVVPEFSAGDTIVVRVKVKEGTRERLQSFEGVVIAKRNRGPELLVHGEEDLSRRRGRARVPDAQPAGSRM